MERFYDLELTRKLAEQTGFNEYFASCDIKKYIVKYQAGEYITSPMHSTHQIQFVVEGMVSVYCIRQDGSIYSLAQGSEQYLLGELELFERAESSIYAQAITDVTCIAISIEEHKEQLLQDIVFMREIVKKLAEKLEMATRIEVIPISLEDRVLNYMNYFCETRGFTGLEKIAFRLHCSARQLQRVMNKLENDGTVQKVGKGSYQLYVD